MPDGLVMAMHKQPTITPERIAQRVTETLFKARTGHGGAPVSYLQMRPDDLRAVIEEAIKLDRSVRKD